MAWGKQGHAACKSSSSTNPDDGTRSTLEPTNRRTLEPTNRRTLGAWYFHTLKSKPQPLIACNVTGGLMGALGSGLGNGM